MFDWKRNLTVAKEISIKSDEEYYRAAISRAYYASFGMARHYLEIKNFPYDNRDGSIHSRVWKSYSLLPNGKEIFVSGDRLKRLRITADYESKINNPKGKSKQSIRYAEEIIQHIEKLCN